MVPVALVMGWKVWSRVSRAREMARFTQRAAQLLAELPATALPPELVEPPPRAQQWGGGYVERGAANFRALALKLLRDGLVRKACVLESSGDPDGDGGWDGRLVYAFHGLDGQIEVHLCSSSVDAMHAALSQGVGSPEPAFDLHGKVGDWLHVLLDPGGKSHVIYESLLLDKPAPPRRPR